MDAIAFKIADLFSSTHVSEARSRVYRLAKSQVVEFVEALFRTAGLEFESRTGIVLALDDWKNGPGDFGDYLIRACIRNMGASGVATFDQTLHTESGFFPPPA